MLTNEQVYRRIIEDAFSTGDLSLIDEFVASDFIEHQRGVRSGAEGLKGLIQMLRSWFPDLTLTVVELVEQGNKVWGRNIARGTHLGTVMGKPATGTSIQIDIIDVCKIVDGKMVEHWGVPDTLGMMEQIGLLPGR
jgi:predicted ester cyclase